MLKGSQENDSRRKILRCDFLVVALAVWSVQKNVRGRSFEVGTAEPRRDLVLSSATLANVFRPHIFGEGLDGRLGACRMLSLSSWCVGP